MPEHIFAPAAEQDLLELADFIAIDDPDAADRLVDKLEYHCSLIAASPDIGRARHDLAPRVRSLSVGNYIILYRSIRNKKKTVEIFRIVHAARDLDSMF